MKKFKAAPQTAKRIKAIVAAAMALTLAVPTTAYFSAKGSKAEAEEAVPEAVATVTFEKGFIGEKTLNGLEVVKSEQILMFKEYKNKETDAYIYDGKSVIYDITDEPVIEADTYKYAVKGNQPSTAYDENLGSVLVFDDTVKVEQFAKKVADDVEEIEIGKILQYETIAHSQVQIKNPFAGKDLSKGATVSYWVKVPTDAAVQTKGANSTLVVFGVKEEDNRKANTEADGLAKKAEKDAEAKLSVQISANNDFHYVASDAGVSVAYEGDGTVLAKPGKWAYVTVAMTDSKVVTYVDGKEVSNKDVAATGLMNALADANTGVFFGGNYSTAAESVGQNFGTVRNTCMDNISFYTSALTADEAAKLYDTVLKEANTVAEPQILEQFTFESGMTGNNGTTISGVSTNKKTDPEVAVDAERGNVLKMNAGTASKSASGQLSANPFAGKDLEGASISYWVKQPADSKLKTVVPSVALSFMDAPKKVVHPKLGEAYVDEESSAVLYTQTDMDAFFHEGYTGQAYQSIKNDFKFSIRKNTHVDDEKGSDGKILDSLYDEDAVAKQKQYEETLKGMEKWHMVTAVFTNAGIKMYLDGQPISNNLAEPDDKKYIPTFFGPRFFDGYYQMQYDGYAPFYRATDNQGARTLMSFLTGTDTSAYIGFMYKVGTNNVFARTYEAYYDNITYYGNALTDAQVAKIYKDETTAEIPSFDPPASEDPTTSENPTDTDAPAPTEGVVSGGAADVSGSGVNVSGDAVSTDDESVVAPKNAYSGKTGDTANIVVPVVALTAAAAALVVASKKRKETEE